LKHRGEDMGRISTPLCKNAMAAAEPPPVERYLHAGQLAEGEKALRAELERKPTGDQLRFDLETLPFLRAARHGIHKLVDRTVNWAVPSRSLEPKV
jgi:hypothetical protein